MKQTNKCLNEALKGISAQSIKPCRQVDVNDETETAYITHRRLLFSYCQDIEIIYVLQFTYGLRISEVLGILAKNISKRGTIVIRGTKGSFDKIVDLPEFYTFFKKHKNNGTAPFYYYSRWFVYRTYKKLAINFGIKYGTLNAVTHQFRYMKARDTMSISNDMELTQRTMGHKNIKSTKHYV
jgi:integrase